MSEEDRRRAAIARRKRRRRCSPQNDDVDSGNRAASFATAIPRCNPRDKLMPAAFAKCFPC